MDQLPARLRRAGVSTMLVIILVACATPAQPTTNTAAQLATRTISVPGQATPVDQSTASPAGQPSSSATQANPTLPACVKVAQTIAMPPEFPANFPLPPGTVITSREDRSGGRTIINTVVPSLDVKGVAGFFEQALPKAGFKITDGESEPGDAEANYEGNGYKGRWKVSSIDGCPGAVTLTVLAAH
jgi:hypothetical protein